jgi:hypothetical protein
MVKKVKSKVKPKSQASNKLLGKVPVDFIFWCHDGRTFSDMKELAEGLAAMSDETFAYHSNAEKKDFSDWVRDVIKDEKLSDELAVAADRMQAVECVAARVVFLAGGVG